MWLLLLLTVSASFALLLKLGQTFVNESWVEAAGGEGGMVASKGHRSDIAALLLTFYCKLAHILENLDGNEQARLLAFASLCNKFIYTAVCNILCDFHWLPIVRT